MIESRTKVVKPGIAGELFIKMLCRNTRYILCKLLRRPAIFAGWWFILESFWQFKGFLFKLQRFGGPTERPDWLKSVLQFYGDTVFFRELVSKCKKFVHVCVMCLSINCRGFFIILFNTDVETIAIDLRIVLILSLKLKQRNFSCRPKYAREDAVVR